MKIAIVGAGISGLSLGQILAPHHNVVLFESNKRPGGLIKCDLINGALFHRTGGHVFNTKRVDVAEFFWSRFDRDLEFRRAERNAVVHFDDGQLVPYPIENHIYCLSEGIQKQIVVDLLRLARCESMPPRNFRDFLVNRFGETLYNIYFRPYNEKVWRSDLSEVALSWLEGKLPMPTLEDIVLNNISRRKEKEFVHSAFYYPKCGGSQFIADRFARGLHVRYGTGVSEIEKAGNEWWIGSESFDKVVFCGNVKFLPKLLRGLPYVGDYVPPIEALHYHGTTTAFCSIEGNPYSWMYMPTRNHESHRIICTGNFSPENNATNVCTGTVEFTNEVSKEEILINLAKIPLSPKYISHHYERYTYPIQDGNSRAMITELKRELRGDNVYLLGRFAEWEYYNMDAAIGAALDLAKEF